MEKNPNLGNTSKNSENNPNKNQPLEIIVNPPKENV